MLYYRKTKSENDSMGKNQYLIRLTVEERQYLNEIVNKVDQTERAVMRAKILLRSDLNSYKDASLLRVAEVLGTSHTTVLTVRTEYHQLGINKAVFRKGRSDNIATRRINTEVRAKIAAITQEEPPSGHKRWSLRLIASEAERRGIVTSISADTVASILKAADVNLQ